MPAVSIIIPNYNHAPFLAQRLDSVFQQTFQDFEVILLDDTSTDNSLEILSAYAAKYADKVAHFIINEKNSGSPFRQWKKGIELAKGEYIWIAESDDWAEVNFLEQILVKSNKQNSKKWGLAFVDSYKTNEEGESIIQTKKKFISLRKYGEKINWFESKYFIEKYMIDHIVLTNASAIVFRKEYIEGIEDYVFTTYQVGDFFFWLHVVSKSDFVIFVSELLNHHRIHQASTTIINNKTKKRTITKEKLTYFNELKKYELNNKSLTIRIKIAKSVFVVAKSEIKKALKLNFKSLAFVFKLFFCSNDFRKGCYYFIKSKVLK